MNIKRIRTTFCITGWLLTVIQSPTIGNQQPASVAPKAPEPSAVKQANQPAPINTIWFAPATLLTSGTEKELTTKLKQWTTAGPFDGFPIRILPPTFADPQDFIPRANALDEVLGGTLIIGTFAVGKDGWETSFNERFARQFGFNYDASKAVTQSEWLKTMSALTANTWAWVLEQPAQMPPPLEATARSAAEFAEIAKAQNRKVIIWISAMGLQPEPLLAILRRVIEATRAQADYFVWMDLPGVVLQQTLGRRPNSPEEGRMTPQMLATMEKLLDQIVTLTPPEKTLIQWTHSPFLPTQDVEGTVAYITACQRKGINRFVLFFSLEGLEQEPWRSFYQTLPKVKRADRRPAPSDS
ncbi:MAG TPA: hypothetical protein VNM72_02620 [Blastocatellia bacterium]|nr:hypothetical protein [Blastocatellia bacterium]